MSWSDGRSGIDPSIPVGGPRVDDLERVDGILRRLKQDKLLQDDIRHPQVRQALAHWTGEKRLPQEEADQLMDENFRIQAVFEKLVELQHACRHAGMSVPLANVLAGCGLSPQQLKRGGEVKPPASEQGTQIPLVTGSRGQRPGEGGLAGTAREVPGVSAAAIRIETPRAGGEKEAYPQVPRPWQTLLMTEAGKAVAVGICALVFTMILKAIRGDDPLGFGNSNGNGVGTQGVQEDL